MWQLCLHNTGSVVSFQWQRRIPRRLSRVMSHFRCHNDCSSPTVRQMYQMMSYRGSNYIQHTHLYGALSNSQQRRSRMVRYQHTIAMSSDSSLIEENKLKHKFSVAPMMDYTDRYQRYFQRLLSNHAVLYTEMATANAIIHRHSRNEDQREVEVNNPIEEPVVLQLGGSDPKTMGQAAKIAATFGWDPIFP